MEDNIYEYLKMDHDKVKKLFDLFDSSKNEKNKLEIIVFLKKELVVHAQAEQAVFYNALLAHDVTHSDIHHSEDEHVKILKKLDELTHTNKSLQDATKLIYQLKEIVLHHVSEEEGKIFREAKKVLSDKESFMLKFKMHDIKGKLLLNGWLNQESLNK